MTLVLSLGSLLSLDDLRLLINSNLILSLVPLLTVLRTLYIIMYPSDTLLLGQISDFKQKKTGVIYLTPVILDLTIYFYLVASSFVIPAFLYSSSSVMGVNVV